MDDQSQSLYRKWRSQTFGALVGQEAVTTTLRHAMTDGRLAHAYLFCGPRGTGKTSTARLLAKMVNCRQPKDGEPCNVCDSCREIVEGRSTDVFEIDAASNRGIDEIRDLRERVRVSGGEDRVRVYVIDEVHMLTEPAFNALLKTLEEPPPRVIFVLATTEAHKVPTTVASRCQQFDFRRISLRDITTHLAQVAAAEGMRVEPGALELIARAAQGGMRDALSLLDQARAFAGDAISTAAARSMLGMADPALVHDLVVFVAQNDTAAGLHRLHDLAQSGTDLRQLAGQIGDLWRQLMLARAGADLENILDLAPDDAADRRELAARFELPALADCARIFASNDTGPHTQIVPQLALELAFLDCVAVVHRPAARREAIADPPANYSAPRPAGETAPARPLTPDAAAPPDRPPLDAARRSSAARPPAEQRPSRPAPDPAHPPVPTPSAAPAPAADHNGHAARPPAPPAAALLASAREHWEVIKKVCKQHNPDNSILGQQVAGMLNGGSAQPVGVDDGAPPVLVIAVQWPALLDKLKLPAHRKVVEWALANILETPCGARFILQSEAQAYLAAIPEPQRAARTESAPVSLPDEPPPPEDFAPDDEPPLDPLALAERDPLVQAVKREFQAAVTGVKRADDHDG